MWTVYSNGRTVERNRNEGLQQLATVAYMHYLMIQTTSQYSALTNEINRGRWKLGVNVVWIIRDTIKLLPVCLPAWDHLNTAAREGVEEVLEWSRFCGGMSFIIGNVLRKLNVTHMLMSWKHAVIPNVTLVLQM